MLHISNIGMVFLGNDTLENPTWDHDWRLKYPYQTNVPSCHERHKFETVSNILLESSKLDGSDDWRRNQEFHTALVGALFRSWPVVY